MAGGSGAEIEKIRESGRESVRLGGKLVLGAAVSGNMPGATCGRIDRLFFFREKAGKRAKVPTLVCARADAERVGGVRRMLRWWKTTSEMCGARGLRVNTDTTNRSKAHTAVPYFIGSDESIPVNRSGEHKDDRCPKKIQTAPVRSWLCTH